MCATYRKSSQLEGTASAKALRLGCVGFGAVGRLE